MKLWQRIERAKEEIFQLNIEIRQVSTHIRNEEIFLRKHHAMLESSNSSLGHEFFARLQLTVETNRHIMRDLEEISKLKGFSGDITPGVRDNVSADSDPCDNYLNDPVDTPMEPECNISNSEDDDEVEASDEAQGALTVVEECCTYQ